jgi:hypothetical protein
MARPMRILQPQASGEAYQFARTYQLGTPREEYTVRYTKQNVIGMIFAFAIGMCLGIVGLVLLVGSADGEGATGSTTIIAFTVALLLIVAALILALPPLLYRSWCVFVCSEGFLFKRGSRLDAFRWDQVAAVWQKVTKRYYNGIYMGMRHKYTIQRVDGAKVAFTDRFPDVEALGDVIAREVTNCQFPRVIAAYNAGQTVQFGPLSVNVQGVSNSREQVPWGQIQSINVDQGFVKIRKEGKLLGWSTVAVSKIPNFFVFMALVNTILNN